MKNAGGLRAIAGRIFCVACVLCVSSAGIPPVRAAADEIRVESLTELRVAAAKARPGDRIVLAAGVHEGSIYIEGLRGEEGRPVVIAGVREEHQDRRGVSDRGGTVRTVIRGIAAGGGEGLHLSGPAWVTVEDLVIEGAASNGINIDDGGDLENPARGVALRRLVVRDVGRAGPAGRSPNIDGIKLSGLAGFRVEDCTIERWGGGGSGIDMVGCRDGLIEGCVLRGGNEAGVDGAGRGGTGGGASGVQMKGGSRGIIVRGCLFEDAGQRALNIGGSTGLAYFRPKLGPVVEGKADRYEAANITVERCVITGSDAAIAFVGVDGAEVRFNTIHHPRRWVMRILQETREPGFVPSRGGRFTDNLVVVDVPRAANVNVGDATAPETFVFARNAWYCDTDPARSKPKLPTEEEGGVYGLDPKLDAELRAGGELGAKVGAGAK